MTSLYQHGFKTSDFSERQVQLIESHGNRMDVPYFKMIHEKIWDHIDELDAIYSPFLKTTSLEDLTPIECAILRLASYELLYCTDVPPKVVVNESIELAKRYGTVEGFKFVNGVLDALLKKNIR